MAPPDLFSDSLHDTVQDPPLVHDLGTVEGGYAELVGQDLPGNPPFLQLTLGASRLGFSLVLRGRVAAFS